MFEGASDHCGARTGSELFKQVLKMRRHGPWRDMQHLSNLAIATTVNQIAQDLCLANRQIGNEENVRAIMQHPAHMAGSDGILVGGRPHPRGWGTFPRYLGHYVRELGILSLTEAVRHMTSAPAARLGLTTRGLVQPGMVADLVAFDPVTIADGATYEQPTLPPVGIPHVWIGGIATVSDGRRTAHTPGRALRSEFAPCRG